MRIPLITVHEWRSIAPLLPPTNDPDKARHGDRLYVSAFYYAEATRSCLENLPAAYGNPGLPRTKRQRWERGTRVPGKLMEAGAPVIERMRAGDSSLIRGASIDWKNSIDFFDRSVIPQLPHPEPRGQFAARRRVPVG